MNCRKRTGGSKFTRVISQRARTVDLTATLGKTRYVKQTHGSNQHYLFLNWRVNLWKAKNIIRSQQETKY